MATDTAVTQSRTVAEPDPNRNIWQVPIFLLGVAVFTSAWQGWLPIGAPDPIANFTRDLAALRSTNDKLTPDRDELKATLARVAAGIEARADDSAEARLALGSGYVRLAELTADPQEARSYWLLATKQFEQIAADNLRDASDAPRLAFRNAKAHAAIGLPATAREADIRLNLNLLASPPIGEDPGDAPRLQAELALRLSPPDMNMARDAYGRYLTSAGIATPPATLARCRLQLAEIHARLGEYDIARKWLEQIGADAPADVVAPAKALLARARMKDEDWLGAARDWEVVRATPGISPEQRAGAAYHLGLCLLNTRDTPAATKLFEEAARSDGPAARGASVRLAELYLKGNDREKRRAVPGLLATAVQGVSDPKEYRSALLPLAEIQPVFELAISVLLTDGAAEAAVRCADVYKNVSPPLRWRERRAESLAAWADALQKEGGDFKPKATAAATEYEAIAELQTAATAKADTLRRAAAMYKLAGSPDKAVVVLQAATRIPDLPDDAIAPVWAELANTLLIASRPDDVWRAFNEAMAAAGTMSTATRHRLGRQFIDTRHPGLSSLGRNLFEQIAKQESVNAEERGFHELALVGLGYEVLRTNNYPEAEVWLRKQIALYPTGTEASLGRLFLGICLIQRAGPLRSDKEEPDAATQRLRDEAIVLFKQVVADADAILKKGGKLEEREAWLRLQAGLRVLQTYQQMKKPNDLLAEAAGMLDRHRGTVDEMIILSLMYHAFKQKKETGRALQTRDQMKELFDRLPAAAFGGPGEYSREYWERVWFAPEPSSPAPK